MVGSDTTLTIANDECRYGKQLELEIWCVLSVKAFEKEGSAKEELGSSILTSATSHTVNEALLLVSVPNKLPPQLQR